MYSIKMPGCPRMYLDTPEEIKVRKEAQAQTELSYPVILTTQFNNKTYRVRGIVRDGCITSSFCEWLYGDKWHRVKNCEIISQIKDIITTPTPIMLK